MLPKTPKINCTYGKNCFQKEVGTTHVLKDGELGFLKKAKLTICHNRIVTPSLITIQGQTVLLG